MASTSRLVGRRWSICSISGPGCKHDWPCAVGVASLADVRTCDVLVQDGVLFQHIVDQLARVDVDDQHFPLSRVSLDTHRSWELGAYISSDCLADGRQDDYMHSATGLCGGLAHGVLTLALGFYDRDHLVGVA